MSTKSHPTESDHPDASHGPARLDRRKFIVAGMGVAAAPLLAPLISGTFAAQADASVDAKPISVRAYGATSAKAPVG